MSKRILIVDDIGFIVEFESTVIDALSKEIKQKILIDSANSVREALAKIAQNDYDAMVVDMNLPDGTGIEIAKAAQAKNAQTRIAALTIYPQKFEQDHTYFDAYFKKPILPAVYKENVRRLLQL
ncbi:response regulator [Sulfurimonas sp. HSL1-2]|uniref:response regulator n=1 Tax=Thiomicrolovo zhangzhouensis TaxID=3131933 RepID=UPI0031F7D834